MISNIPHRLHPLIFPPEPGKLGELQDSGWLHQNTQGLLSNLSRNKGKDAWKGLK